MFNCSEEQFINIQHESDKNVNNNLYSEYKNYENNNVLVDVKGVLKSFKNLTTKDIKDENINQLLKTEEKDFERDKKQDENKDSTILSIKSFICSNCNFEFSTESELAEHTDIEHCINETESCVSDIDLETVKTLITLDSELPPNGMQKSKKMIYNLFPYSSSKETYIQRFLQNGPGNILHCFSEIIKVLEQSLEFCFVTEQNICCVICNETCINELQLFYEHIRSEKHVVTYNFIAQNYQTVHEIMFAMNLAKNCLVQVSKYRLECICCKVHFKNYHNKIINHTNSRNHQLNISISQNRSKILLDKINAKLHELWYDIERYWCEPCNLKFFHEIHFSNHLDTRSHKQNVANGKYYFDVCIPCGSLWLGLSNTYSKHSQILIHKYMLSHKVYELNRMPDSVVSLIQDFEHNKQILLEDAKNAELTFQDKRNQLVESIDELLRPHFPEVKIQFFGSRVTGVCCSKGAIDINLTFGYKSVKSENCFLTEVQNYFIEKPEVWETECVMMRENVPIIHLFHIPTKFKCNISIGDSLSVEKMEITKIFIDNYSQIKEMIIFLKRWSFLCELWSSKGISTFTIIWLVIYYFQRKWNFTSIFSLMQQRHLSHFTNDGKYKIVKENNQSHSIECLNVKQLLIGYFKFYSDFDYKEQVLCPLLGEDVKKEVLIIGKSVPEEMLFNQTAEDFSNSFHVESPFCLQDPLECKLNITKAVNKQTVKEFKYYCAESAKLFMNNIV